MSDVSYTRVNWQNSPDTTTPISAANLNIMDKGVSDCATAINGINTAVSNCETAISNKATYGGTACNIALSLSGDVLTITTS